MIKRLFLVYIFIMVSFPVAADTLSVGVPTYPAGVNYLESRHPMAMFMRRAVLATLTELVETEGAGPGYQMSLADGLRASADFKNWSFRIRPAARFSNGETVTAEDVKYSLKRCPDLLEGQGVSKIEARRVEVSMDVFEEWVDVAFAKGVDSERSQRLPLIVASCPILEARSTELFGDSFATGSNIVSAGGYAVAHFKDGKSIILNQVKSLGRVGTTASTIELRGFSDPVHSLTALRLGTLDVLFPLNLETLQKAKEDETLLVKSCSSYNVVVRRGLRLKCNPTLKVSELSYRE